MTNSLHTETHESGLTLKQTEELEQTLQKFT